MTTIELNKRAFYKYCDIAKRYNLGNPIPRHPFEQPFIEFLGIGH